MNFSRVVNEPAPLPEQLRASFGKVGVLPDVVIPEPNLPRIPGRAETMGMVALGTFLKIDRTLKPEKHLGAIPLELLYGPPLAGTVGVLAGLVAGVPKKDLRKAEINIRKAIQEEPLERGIQAKIHTLAGEQRRMNLVPIAEIETAGLKSRNPTNAAFQVLAASGADSVLLVRMVHHRFESDEGIQPSMSFSVEAQIAVIRVLDAQVITRSSLAYRSQERSFIEWGAHGAKPLRMELETARSLLAELILDQYFGPGGKN